MIYNVRSIRIEINLDPGIYVFDEYSATGKTYLCKLLDEISSTGEDVYSITYNSWKKFNKIIIEDITTKKYDLILFDRYGMYANDAYNIVKMIDTSNTVVLLESKTTLGSSDLCAYPCMIEFTSDKVVVCE